MDISTFRHDFLQDIRSTAATYGDGSCAAFVNIFSNYLTNAEVIPDFEASFYTGTGLRRRKIRVDGYSYDELDLTMNLVVADFIGDEADRTLTKTEAESLFELPLRFVEESLGNNLQSKIEVSTSASDLVDILINNKDRIRKYKILLYTDGFMSGKIESFSIKQLGNANVEFQIWDIERLYNVVLADFGRESIEINFKEFVPNGLPCLETDEVDNDHYKSFLSVIPGTILADIYDNFGAQLLEGNVRSFLSTKVSVNKKIRETILTSPKMFFAFNNGISATANVVEVESNTFGKFITRVSDFQIINGGQTTASLSNARYKDKANLDNISVQMKLTAINTGIDSTYDLMQKISRSSNSQNKVSDADFFSTHPYHVRMEQISRRLYAPAVGGAQHDTHWFYERARGQYLQAQMQMSKGERNKFLLQNPKAQLLSKTDLAKARNSWRCLPHTVSKGAQTNFTEFANKIDAEWSVSEESFNEKYFQDSVALYILFKHTESLVTKQPWYDQGYRANIVTYSIALLSHLIQRNYPKLTLDFNYIWNKQSINEVLTKQLIVITKEVFNSITSPSRGIANVTQWCKRDACWKAISDLDVEMLDELVTVLVAKDELKSEIKIAKKEQKVISGIEAQMKVVNLGADYWKQMKEFLNNNNMKLSILEGESLKIACLIPSKLPNQVHSQQLVNLIDKAKIEGWTA
ncbi:AIPR protein [Paenibacillus swuensis]|uniref:AIPR protein n=1 Tax=Paenibacillus swuensis TaxID=1178515 RepID=A0A172TDY8_9BACL|nr:AIPR family protein [Paenibacillus swuensis]ANE45251.1 AIPR protein [Paenibacillus swuensis]